MNKLDRCRFRPAWYCGIVYGRLYCPLQDPKLPGNSEIVKQIYKGLKKSRAECPELIKKGGDRMSIRTYRVQDGKINLNNIKVDAVKFAEILSNAKGIVSINITESYISCVVSEDFIEPTAQRLNE